MLKSNMDNIVSKSLSQVIKQFPDEFKIYRTSLNEYNEPCEKPTLLCEGVGLYHESVYRQLTNSYTEQGVGYQNVPGKYFKILKKDIVCHSDLVSAETLAHDIHREDLFEYNGKTFTIISTGVDQEDFNTAFYNLQLEEVKPYGQ
jgi:hypothetical protein